MGRACSIMEEKTNACRNLVGKPEKKGPLGRLGIGRSIILKWISK
jgi:hypothetical protein